MSELKPCPFCGITEAKIKGKKYEDAWDRFKPIIIETDGLLAPRCKAVMCQNCGVILPNVSDGVDEWNTRKPDEWISVEDEPKKNGHYQIWDNGYGEGLFHEGEWKSTDRPIRNAMGVQCLRATIHPTHYAPIPTAPKEKG